MRVDIQKISLKVVLLSSAFFAISLLVALFIILTQSHKTLADNIPLSFSAGRIIDDGVFTDTTTMSASQIQTFLNSKVPVCDTYGTQPSEYGGGTRAQWAANASLHPQEGAFYPPFTCLKDYTENGLSAAQIIYNIAQQYQVNPEVLIVLLQKEESLVTDTWPSPIQYQNAAGYGCPDSTPGVCDSSYYGFTNQLTHAAALFHGIETNNPNFYSQFGLGNYYVQYNPDSSCGGSVVNIQNRATQALYSYTPYQPNAATLAAPMGTTVDCGAYGNIHFWQYFTQWFGSTYSPNYAWRLVSQEVFTDQAMTIPANINTLAANTTYYFRIRAINTGNTTWTNSGANPVNLATTAPSNRTSAFCNNSWISCGRPTTLQESSVAPSGQGTFVFSATTPSQYGTYNEHFNLVAEGNSWFNDFGLYWPLTVTKPTTTWRPTAQQIYLDPAHTQPANISDLAPNTTYYAAIWMLNTGNTSWTNNGTTALNLGTSSPNNRTSVFSTPSWLSSNRPARLQETTVSPGQTGTFNFTITTPANYGTYKEYFTPVIDGVQWLNDVGMYWPLTVAPPTPEWSIVSQVAYTGSDMSTSYDTGNTTNGARFYLSIKALNTGNTTWTNSGADAVRLGTSNPQDGASPFYDPSWITMNRITTLTESSVAPGQVGTFNFWVTAPYNTNNTTVNAYFRPVIDGVTWFNDIGMYQPFTFNTPITSWVYNGQATYTDASHTHTIDLASAAQRNTTYYLTLSAKNTGGVIWRQSTMHLGTSNPNDRISSFYDASSWLAANRPATLKQSSVAPGQTGTFEFTMKTPNTTLSSNEHFTPLIEGMAWLTDLGVSWTVNVP